LIFFVSEIFGSQGTLLWWGVSARSMGLGNAGVAARIDSFSGYYNPALLAKIERKEIGVFQSNLWENTNYSFLSYVHPLLQKGCFGFYLLQLKNGGAVKTDESNIVSGTFDFNQMAVGLNYGKDISSLLSWGLSLKTLNSTLDRYSQTFITFDTGFYYKINSYLNSGANFQNIISYTSSDTDDTLPMILKIGFEGKIIPEKINVFFDITNNIFKGKMFDFYSLGFELQPLKILYLRIGKNNNEITGGFGIEKTELLNFDYAISLHNEFGSSHKISLNFKFGKPVKLEKIAETPETPEIETPVVKQLTEEELKEFQDAYQNAIDSYRRGLFSKALDDFTTARKIDFTDSDIPLYLERLKLVVQIIPQCISPGKTNDLIRRGVTYFVEGNGENAVKVIAYALSLEPENFTVSRLLTRIEEYTKIRTEKIQSVEGMSLVDQKLYEVLVNFRKKDYSKVIDLCKEILILEPDNVLAYKRLGSAFYALGEKTKAKEVWKKALEFGPDKKLEEILKKMEK